MRLSICGSLQHLNIVTFKLQYHCLHKLAEGKKEENITNQPGLEAQFLFGFLTAWREQDACTLLLEAQTIRLLEVRSFCSA